MLFLAMQVRVMAACMESQIDKQEYTASAQQRYTYLVMYTSLVHSLGVGKEQVVPINQPSDVCDM